MIAPGVSSTIRSTPVASSSARMLRPSRPMMRPFRSSLGRSTTDTVVSIACSAPQRWMASVMYCLARSTAVSRASASSRFSRFAESCRASPSICLISSSFASSAVSPATRSSSCLLLRDELVVPRRGGRRSAVHARASLCRGWRAPFRAVRSAPDARRAPTRGGPASVPAPPPAGGRHAPAAPLPSGCRGPSLWRRGAPLSCVVSASRSASRDQPLRLLLRAADGVGGDALAIGDPDGEHRAADDQRDDGREQSGTRDLREIRQHA